MEEEGDSAEDEEVVSLGKDGTGVAGMDRMDCSTDGGSLPGKRERAEQNMAVEHLNRYPDLVSSPSCILLLLLEYLSWLWRGTQRGLSLPLQAHPTHPQGDRIGLFIHLADTNTNFNAA
ncbi:hypothetical protein EYF80_036119 [Liparis tanakae]|uniref:Uncharacterized protein n=1 Tax=Liparis tanakae TaxID=230148 RepID=A0A4Z2GLH7_9TELE|nr:hypothetical protein EYF80_036119 [Liparis tanakae]